MEYTKGEWKIEPVLNETRVRIMSYSPAYFRIAIADVFGTIGDDKDNAHLIAAAPDMYEALKTITRELDKMRLSTEAQAAYMQGIKALTKADRK